MKTLFASLFALAAITATANASPVLTDLQKYGQIVTVDGILGAH